MRNILIAVGGLLALVLLYWLISPVFITTVVDDAIPESASSSVSAAATERLVVTSSATATESVAALPTPVTEPVLLSQPIIGTPSHPASGSVRLITTPTERIIRYENYQGTNGPDLYVYLASDLDATSFISLGRARGNQGNLNYAIPEGTDLSQYPYVLTWCRAFGVLFDYATLPTT